MIITEDARKKFRQIKEEIIQILLHIEDNQKKNIIELLEIMNNFS
jgi:hypothetical protein